MRDIERSRNDPSIKLDHEGILCLDHAVLSVIRIPIFIAMMRFLEYRREKIERGVRNRGPPNGAYIEREGLPYR
jgi:hypothetical protein